MGTNYEMYFEGVSPSSIQALFAERGIDILAPPVPYDDEIIKVTVSVEDRNLARLTGLEPVFDKKVRGVR